jgi:hypothetical protein
MTSALRGTSVAAQTDSVLPTTSDPRSDARRTAYVTARSALTPGR